MHLSSCETCAFDGAGLVYNRNPTSSIASNDMYLAVDGYVFPMEVRKEEWADETTVLIADPSCKSKACIILMIDDSSTASLQLVHYYPSCNISKKYFEKRSGAMQLLIKSSLYWLMQTYTHVKRVTFSDDSYLEFNGDTYMLPEKMFLTEGTTWYAKHFSAKPTKKTKIIVKRFQRAYDEFGNTFRQLPMKSWKKKYFKSTIEQVPYLLGFQLSGSEWYIARKTIESYNVLDVKVLKRIPRGMDGGAASASQILASIPRFPRPHVWF